ncbi:bifunctional 4-hydroxy-2-oxoglutarate aldolase/2-dehydro-3-deoxy-phosphogluconate aldolase [Pseudozobellia thermophila]|uniref:2-dehydro-3-deoxyphosphogluconate aldolase / (4S)-4-hydroxy-2-oxoglutarate aldolase n=1 Tax=Pseudozobellia thermophila TaxID=192903 RepID=A0A1M6BAX2_9FLAO|nr:bifunctional 4-hydroxy-2-oxoglutarate aldolase/2-dehydro-3-deoxy-phosphogluconate aldolase [Pseudozobellia thermophila]SHI45900.1 2-dehydro-3-deoxyphosphogluconate aldolase / (4S)-4-hydroxy-2-oxoglutarate aldolase [Pseudozobellia thermophila]
MCKDSFSWTRFKQNPVVGILRGLPTDEVVQLVPSYLKSGFYTLEVTMNSPEVTKTIGVLRKEFPELNVGAGTVCSVQDLDRALAAGAQFIVTPIVDAEVIGQCAARKIPIFPGAYTPTEIYTAWKLGASAVKVFPATQLGPQYFKDVLAPLNEIKLLPTGGVSADNIRAFFEAGAIGAGMGSSLFDKDLIAKGDFAGLERHFKKVAGQIDRH